MMNEFLGKDFKEEYLAMAASKKGDDYYLKMMIAWMKHISMNKSKRKLNL